MQKIILVGYMAVGKSTIAQLLSKKNQFTAVDLDKLIENKLGLSINEIFEQQGEIYFRKIEHETFKEVLEGDKDAVISTGGGTPCYANNHLLLNGSNVVSIYLKASLEVILERLQIEKKERPLVKNQSDEALREFVAKHLFERSYFYNQATLTVSVDNKSPEVIVDEIFQLLY